MISVHPEFSRLFEKLARRSGGDAAAMIDPHACRDYAQSMTGLLDRRLAQE